MEHSYQNSTIAQIIDAIINQLSFEGESKSDIADILLSILNQTSYEKEPDSVIAELFIKLKAKIEGESFEPFDKSYLGNIAEIIKSILDETEYNDAPKSRIAELLLELKEELEAYTEISVSGAIASFVTNVAKALVNYKAYFSASQESGTPTPQNPLTISGVSAVNITHCGANLFDEVMELGVLDSNGEIQSSTSNLVSTNKFAVKGGTILYFSCAKKTSTNQRYGVAFYDKDENFISGSGSIVQTSTFTPPQNACFMRFFVPLSWYISSIYENDISVNYPSTDTEYHAYDANSNEVTIDLDGTYYGGYVDSEAGKLKITHKKITLNGTQTIALRNWQPKDNSIGFAYSSDEYDGKRPPANNTALEGLLSDQLTTQSYSSIYGGSVDWAISVMSSNTYGIFVRLGNPNLTTDQLINAYLSENPIDVLYPLAEPIEIPLSDLPDIITMIGTNNIFADTGNIELTYLYKGTPEE